MSFINNPPNITETFIIEPLAIDDIYTTGATLINNIIYFDRTDMLSAYTANLTTLVSNDTYVTGMTFSNNLLTITRNDGVSISSNINSFTGLSVSGSISASTFYGDGSHLTGISTQDTFVSGGTYSNGTAIFTNNAGGTFSVSGFSTGYTLTKSEITSTLGYTPLSAITSSQVITALGYTPISADTNTFTTGGTYSAGTAVFTNNTGGTYNVTGFTMPFTGGSISNLTATTISATTYLGLPADIHTTGFTFNPATYDLTIKESNGTNFTQNLAILATDMTVTGGTYNPTTGVATFNNNTGGTFTVNGFFKPSDDIYVTSGSIDHDANVISLVRTDAGTVLIDDVVTIIEKDITDIIQLINDGKLVKGVTYKINNCDSELIDNGSEGKFSGTTVYLLALERNKLADTGVGIFYTPKYSQVTSGFNVWSNLSVCDFTITGGNFNNDENITGDNGSTGILFGDINTGYFVSLSGDWSADTIITGNNSGSQATINSIHLKSYNADDVVFWGGYAWRYKEKGLGTALNNYVLEGPDLLKPLDDDNLQYYNTSYDVIKYDIINDLILYRNEKNTNIVTASAEYIKNNHNPIRGFQWGNLYSQGIAIGIGGQYIENSTNENINFRGSFQIYINMVNNSSQTNMFFENSSSQARININNGSQFNIKAIASTQHDIHIDESGQSNILLLNDSNQSYVTLKNKSYQQSINIEGTSHQTNLLLDGSYQQNINIFDVSNQEFLSFKNSSYQNGINIVGHSYQQNFNFDNQSYQTKIELNKNVFQTNFYFIDGSYQDSLTLSTSYQNNLTLLNGSYQRNFTFNESSYQDTIKLNNGSYQNTNTFNKGGYQQFIDFDNQSYQTNIIIIGGRQVFLTLNNGSYHDKISLLDGGIQQFINLNNSYQSNITTNSSNGQNNITMTNQSYQDSITINSPTGNQDSLTFTNNSYQSNIQVNGGQINLIFENGGGQVNGIVTVDNQLNCKFITYVNDYASGDIGEHDEIYISDKDNTATPTNLLGIENNKVFFVNTSTLFSNNLANYLNVNVGATVSGPTRFTGGLSANTFSATTYLGLPLDIRVTGGTYSSGTATFRNNTGGTFTVTGFSTSTATAFTGGTVTGATIFTGGLSANTISATTYLGLPTDIRVTGGTYSSGTAIFTNNTGGTFNISGFTTPFTGGTVAGPSNFTNGLTANTISATTYANLPIDIRVTGGTYSNGTSIFTNNTGGTFSVTGFTTPFTGGTVNGLTATTISATTYLGLPIDIDNYLPLSGGSVSGGTSFTNGLSANTISATSINPIDYIVFNTGTTIPVTQAGTTFFNNTEQSLAYNTSLNQLVTVNMGQQLYTRVYNGSGGQLDKGTVVAITGTTNGVPSIIKATNNHAAASPTPIGLTAEIIPNNSLGLVINNGILSGITLNTFNNGDALYLSPFSAGTYVAGTSSFPFSARTNQIGYVLQTGTTTGKIYVKLNVEDNNLSLTDIERNTLEGNVISSGCYTFTGLSVSGTTTINIAPVQGWVVKNTYNFATLPDVTNVIYSGGTNIPVTNINISDQSYILLTSASTIVQQTTFPTPQQRRENIYLGKVVHPNRTTIQNVNNTPDFDVSPMAALRDLWTPLKLVNLGVVCTPNGANLNFNTSSGTIWGNGIGWVSNQQNPNSVSISGMSPTTFQYRVQTGGTFSNTTSIDVGHYDVNGVVTTIPGPNATSTNQRIYLFSTGNIRIQYGQTTYNSLAAAVSASQTETFIENSTNRDNGLLIGILSVVKNATNLSNNSQAVFNFVSKFGEVLGGTGGLSTTTLQQAYNNSTTPEILTNSTLGGLSLQNGTGNADNITNNFESQNTAGTITALIRADGLISGSSMMTPSLTATTISATTYFGLPIDVYTTGGTYSNGTAVFTNNTGGTFNVIGFTTPFTGGTVTGVTNFTNALSAFTLNVNYTGNTNQTPVLLTVNDNNFYQYGIKNSSSGTNAASEFTLGANNGDINNNFFAFGINNSTFSQSGYTIYNGNSGYLLMNGGQMNIGTQTGHDIVFHTNGTLAANERMRIKSGGTVTATAISATSITSPTIKTYGVIIATSMGYQNLF